MDLLDGRSRLANPASLMQAKDFRRIAQEMARCDAGTSRPRRLRTPERAALAGVLAHPAAPSWQDPTKAFLPGALCVDPIGLTLLVVRALSQRGNRPPGD